MVVKLSRVFWRNLAVRSVEVLEHGSTNEPANKNRARHGYRLRIVQSKIAEDFASFGREMEQVIDD